jgi:hypothetical protein
MFAKTGSLLLSIGNLPPQVSRKDLRIHTQKVIDQVDRNLVRRNAIGRNIFRLSPTVCRCTILKLTDPVSGTVFHHGLVSIHPPKLALEAMDLLGRTPLRGAQLKVSRYRHGSFPIDSHTPLTTISDLLVADEDRATGVVQQKKLDLVSDTGASQDPIPPSETARAAGAFAT